MTSHHMQTLHIPTYIHIYSVFPFIFLAFFLSFLVAFEYLEFAMCRIEDLGDSQKKLLQSSCKFEF